jgi:hypothetical protein
VVNCWCGSGVHNCAFTRLVPTGFAQDLLAYPCVYQYVYPFGDELQNHYIQQRFEVKFSIQLHDTNIIMKSHQTAGTPGRSITRQPRPRSPQASNAQA